VVVAAVLLGAVGCGDDAPSIEPAAETPATTTAPTTTAPPAATEPPAALGEATEPVVVGHRGGADGEHPDNSLEAFAGAADLGATWVELDVRLSADGEVVLSHDMATAAGSAIAGTSAADLADEGIPTLDQALDVIDENHLGVDVELKALPTEEGYDPTLAIVDATVAVVEAHPIDGPVLFSSFNREALDRVRELAGDDWDTVFITQGIGGAEDLATTLVDGGHDGLAIGDPALPRSMIRVFGEAGLPVWSWTIDGGRTAQRLVRRGVVGIITDVPAEISAALT
jgi:glycerophosphoryl diester phosphodiesterase